MKAIIPVAGAGTKLRPLTYTQPKALIPIAGKTILSVIVDQLLDAGVSEFVFVIGYLGEKIERYLEKNYPDLQYSIINQSVRRGTGHAIWLTKDVVGEHEELIIVLGDTICDFDLEKMIASEHSQIAVKKVDDPRLFGVAEINDDYKVLRVVEKPLIPKSNMALVGIYYIKESRQLFDVLQQENICHLGGDEEYPLTDALQKMIENNIYFEAFKVNNWFDCGKKEILLSTNATLLRHLYDSNALGNVERYSDSVVIIPPVSIAEGCVLRNAIIGPNVTIGENSTIVESVIKNSIIGSYTQLEEVVLHSSIIGSDANVRGMSQSLNIGDNTEIDFG